MCAQPFFAKCKYERRRRRPANVRGLSTARRFPLSLCLPNSVFPTAGGRGHPGARGGAGIRGKGEKLRGCALSPSFIRKSCKLNMCNGTLIGSSLALAPPLVSPLLSPSFSPLLSPSLPTAFLTLLVSLYTILVQQGPGAHLGSACVYLQPEAGYAVLRYLQPYWVPQ